MNEPDNARLREIVRAQVIQALQAAAQPAADSSACAKPGAPAILAVLFTGMAVPQDEFFAQIETLAQQGFALSAVLSDTFSRTRPAAALVSRAPSLSVPALNSEEQIQSVVAHAEAAILPDLSLNTAAKLASGIQDSTPARLLTGLLIAGKPIFIARDISSFGRDLAAEFPKAPPAFLRIAEDNIHKVQQLGAQFLNSEKLAATVIAAFQVHPNETPERLARQRPFPKRAFVTQEDVHLAVSQGKRELICAAGAIITDQARDYAATNGIHLRCETH